MLASIHPLGERARDNRWGTTVTWYAVGSLAGGVVTGTLAGLAGWVVAPPVTAAAVVGATVAVAAAAHEAGLLRGSLPGPRRQVDEDWLHRYRGWVYGLGFGFQLGMGVTTIVTTAAVPLTFVLAFLTGSPLEGALVGGVFGLARAAPVLGTHTLTGPGELRDHHRRLAARATGARRTVAAVLGAVGVALVGVALVGVGGAGA